MSAHLNAPVDHPHDAGFGLGLLLGVGVGAGLALWLSPRLAAQYGQARVRVGEAAAAVADGLKAVERVATAARF